MSERIDINDRSIPGHVRRRLVQADQWRRTKEKKDSGQAVDISSAEQTRFRPSFSEYYDRVARAAMMNNTDVSGVVHKVAKHWDSSEWNGASESGREGD